LNREAREENIFCGLRGYRFCHIMRWIPSLKRVTFQFIRKPMERSLRGSKYKAQSTPLAGQVRSYCLPARERIRTMRTARMTTKSTPAMIRTSVGPSIFLSYG
jgi:hypothetical protein